MELTEIHVRPVQHHRGHDRGLKAYVDVVIDGVLKITGLRIVHAPRGFMVSMPNHKLTGLCSACGARNHLRAKYCNECASTLDVPRSMALDSRKFHADIVHPVNETYRGVIEQLILEEYAKEMERLTSLGTKRPVFAPLRKAS